MKNVQRDVSFNQEFSEVLSSPVRFSQTVFARLEGRGSFSRARTEGPIPERTIHITLENSAVGPGDLRFDVDRLRGLFVDRVKLSMWLQSPDGEPDPSRALSAYFLEQDSPQGQSEGGSVSSTITYRVGGGAGLVGETPMGSADAGISISSAHTHSLADFVFLNRTSGSVVSHEVTMEQLGDGSRYLGPDRNLQLTTQVPRLPNLATSSLPLGSQGLWTNRDGEGLLDRVRIVIRAITRFSYLGVDLTKQKGVGGGNAAAVVPDPRPIGGSVEHTFQHSVLVDASDDPS